MSIKNVGNGKWKIVVTKRISGKPNIKREATISGNKFSAQEKEIELKRELNNLVEKQKRSLKSVKNGELKTFGECLDDYEKSGRTIKYSNFNRLKDHLYNSRLTNEVGEKGIWQDLQKLITYLKNDFSPATINRHIAMAKGAITDAFKANKIKFNYLSGFEQLDEKNIVYNILSNRERLKLFLYLPEHLKPLVYTAMLLPTRISELLLLTYDHISEDCKKITFKDGEVKGGKGRWLPILPELRPYFESIKRNNYNFVFSTDGKESLGKWSSKDNVYKLPSKQYGLYNDACRKANIKGYNFHKTRQQAAMQMLYDKIPEHIIMRVGGWSTHKAFYRYVNVDDRQMEEAFGIDDIWDDSWKVDLAPKAF